MVFWNNRKTGEKDVTFKVLYCGICHSDLHKLKNDWNDSIYPLVPGYDLYFLFNNVSPLPWCLLQMIYKLVRKKYDANRK